MKTRVEITIVVVSDDDEQYSDLREYWYRKYRKYDITKRKWVNK